MARNNTDLRILFVVFLDARHGMGHWYRTSAAIQQAEARGHDTALAGCHSECDYHLKDIQCDGELGRIVASYGPDWIVFDLLDTLPVYVARLAYKYHAKVALLNGVGRIDERNGAHIVWIQDHPERVILRPQVLKMRKRGGDKWFVWGGASDEIGLCRYFSQVVEWPAWLVTTSMAPPLRDSLHWQQQVVSVDGDDILHFMECSGRACIHMGMTAWELARLGIPLYLVSKDKGHLHFARNMEKLGLALAYPEVGLPRVCEVERFLSRPYKISGRNRPDGKGAVRFIETLEQYT